MRINTNVSSLSAQENAINTNNNIKSSLEKLSSGLKINKASDDASGLAIADKLRTQATSVNQGISNGNSAVTLLQIADKSMAEQSNILDTVKSKLIQANTDTTSEAGRESIRKDINKLLTQLDNIAQQTNYNGTTLLSSVDDAGKLNGQAADSLKFQIGETNNDIISTAEINSTTVSLGGGEKTIGKVKAGETEQLKNVENGTMTVKAETGHDLDVNVSGSLGKVTATGGAVTLQTTDAATIKKLDTLAAADANFTKSGTADGVYTLTVDEEIDLSTVDLKDAKLTGGAATGITTDSSSLKVSNNDNVNDLEVSVSETIAAESSSTVQASAGESIKVATSGTGVNVNVQGDVGTLSSSGAPLTLKTDDAALSAQLKTLADNDNTIITNEGNGKFELKAGKSIDLAGYNITDLNITAATATFTAGDNAFSMSGKEEITIINNSAADGLNITNGSAKSSDNLASLKNLGEGELTKEAASSFQGVVDDAITKLNGYRGDIGSTQNQVESAVRNLMTQATNVKAAESIIRDVDYAQESANFNKQNIISQAGSYAMSQANATQQNVLRLLQ